MGLFGGSASSSQSLNSNLAFNPVINVGDGNSSDTRSRLKGTADATATAKDEFGLSAGVAVGPNASAMGGPVGVGDTQPMKKKTVDDSSFFNDTTKSIKHPIYLVLGVGGVAVAYYYYKKKKRK